MEDLNVIIAGAAGEGIQTVGEILADLISAKGYGVFTWQEYESRVRGGQNSYAIRISEGPQNSPLAGADILLALNDEAQKKYDGLLNDKGILIAQKRERDEMIAIPFEEIAEKEIGKKIYSNTVAIGALCGVLDIDLDSLKAVLVRIFSKKGDDVVKANYKAAETGFGIAKKDCKNMCPWKLPPIDDKYFLIDSNKAIALGAARAGCRFIAAYPMTPSTGIITYLVKNQELLGVFAEQAEDEIAAVNMAIGASYAGVRSMTATSGGGFSLMVEGISLAGMTETPLVIVLAQRPGPATGLPTRTAQGDLLFAINAGHGEFPKMVMAPSDPKDAFHKTIRAFDLADKYQIPVIILTDQFLADSYFSIRDFEFESLEPEFDPVDPSSIEKYRRYRITDDGISPRLYPGQSKHLICADSDEHNEFGHITEDLSGIASAMADKRVNKMDCLKKNVKTPEEINVKDSDIFFIGWGSTRGAILESIKLLKQDEIHAGMIHFTELWPLPDYRFPEGKDCFTVEGNITGQLGRLLKSDYAISFKGSINRYDGLPITGEYIRRIFHDNYR